MIYTVGNCENYDKQLINDNLFKSKGGSVWKNIEEVTTYFKTCKVYINDKEVDAAIYIVDANWETDVIDNKLNKPCKIINRLI